MSLAGWENDDPRTRLVAHRDEVIRDLLRAVGDGRLSFAEYCDRADAVAAATSDSEIDSAHAGIPAGATAPTDTQVQSRTLLALFGDVRRAGSWRVGSETVVYSVFGNAVLDLRAARLEPGDVEITFFGIFGDSRVIVPDGVEVTNEGITVFGDHRTDVRGDPRPGTPRVVVRHYLLFGDSRVVSESSTEHWLARLRKKLDRD
ncbi:DUF1707 domain-containing protein [Epidermidibacterium keratini]|uniref:DUF1707 domain-containing protein n=1 Tax=Epidermidibacterium keratini TaxID=1891644 RepID=A0A7L4YPE0_9ACTN|nr:LiaF domain-containing protein [Epidermidibacterium keratini]QHC00763.1 DUF1707 domain-containing protein [Epidermidibacterium keratini]